MANLQYIGARYVPKLFTNPDDNSNNWKSGIGYEPLTIVTYLDDSYTSKITVPGTVGNPLDNPTYWVKTGNYNATLIAIQNEISGINNKIGNETLNSTATTLAGAINETLANKNFMSQRYGSIHSNNVALGQAAIYYNNKFYFVGNDNGNSINVAIVNNDMTIDSFVNLSVTGHANSIFIDNDNLYIVDSSNDLLYKVDPSTLTLIDTINPNIGHFETACVYDDNIYFANDTIITVCDKNLSIVDIIIMEQPYFAIHSGIVKQNIFIDEDNVYILCNRPNAIIVYDLKGHLSGVIDIGVGDGFYPYGELESIFLMDNKVAMMSTLWDDTANGFLTVQEIFITNLNGYTISDSVYGQRAHYNKQLIVNPTAAHSQNANGTSSYPFDTMFEACCVYNYITKLYDEITAITINGNITDSSDLGIFVNDIFSINFSNSAYQIPTLKLYNAFGYMSQGIIDTLDCSRGKIIADRMQIKNLYMSANSFADLNGCNISDSLSMLGNSLINGKYNKYPASVSNITVSGGILREFYSESGVDVVNNHYAYPAIVKKFFFDRLKGTPLVIDFNINVDNTAYIENKLRLVSSQKDQIINGTTVSRIFKMTYYYSNDFLTTEFRFNIDTDDIYLSDVTTKDSSNNVVSTPPLYLEIHWSEAQIRN